MSNYKFAVWTVAIVLYWLMPLDLIPDFLLLIGFADDVLFTAYGVSQARKSGALSKALDHKQS